MPDRSTFTRLISGPTMFAAGPDAGAVCPVAPLPAARATHKTSKHLMYCAIVSATFSGPTCAALWGADPSEGWIHLQAPFLLHMSLRTRCSKIYNENATEAGNLGLRQVDAELSPSRLLPLDTNVREEENNCTSLTTCTLWLSFLHVGQTEPMHTYVTTDGHQHVYRALCA